MAYFLIILGLVCVASGGYMLRNKTKATPAPIEASVNETPQKADNYDENKAKGDAFEAFVVKQFSSKYFTLQEWRGDKYVEGHYPVSNHFPDLEVSFNHNEIEDHFAIECKWRKDYYQGGVEWAKGYQLSNYKAYAQKTQIPVYLVIGVGGEPSHPKELFVVPLKKINHENIYKSTLELYSKAVDKPFYWDFKEKVLQ